MNVAILTSWFLPMIGGIESFTHILADSLARDHGYDVTVVTETLARLPEEDALTYRVLRSADPQVMVNSLADADVIIQNSGSPQLALILTLLGTPRIRILHAHDDNFTPATPRQRALWRARLMVGRWWAHRAHLLVAVSQYLADVYRADLAIHNGHDASVFTRNTAPESRDPHALVTVGRLHRDKGIDLALRAVALLRSRGVPVTLRVIGDGAERWSLEELARSLEVGPHVTFEGSLDPKAVNTALNDSAILVMPTRVPEAFGLAIVEAQAAGCAVVASDSGGVPEALDGFGLTFTPGSPDDLADKIQLLVESEDRRLAAVPSAERMAARSGTAMAARYATEIERLVAR